MQRLPSAREKKASGQEELLGRGAQRGAGSPLRSGRCCSPVFNVTLREVVQAGRCAAFDGFWAVVFLQGQRYKTKGIVPSWVPPEGVRVRVVAQRRGNAFCPGWLAKRGDD